jgi:hypothetical protein
MRPVYPIHFDNTNELEIDKRKIFKRFCDRLLPQEYREK